MAKNKIGLKSVIFITLMGLVVFVYMSEMFERKAPVVKIKKYNKFWNLKTPISFKISDNVGVKSYRVYIKENGLELFSENFMLPKKNIIVNIKSIKKILLKKELTIVVEANDASKWNMLKGNKVYKEFVFKIDRKKPELNAIVNSYGIANGGSALVIFEARDANLKGTFILANTRIFKPQPFYKDGFYISLIAWPIQDKSFDVWINAVDLAGNRSRERISIKHKKINYKISNIHLKDRFLNGKIAELADEFKETEGVIDSIEQFKIINEDIRAKNENLIHKIGSQVSNEKIDDFKINRMYPLKNAQVVARFGDYRKYYYNKVQISESYHLGIDFASVARASVKPKNSGKIVYADYNGIYGNMPILDHGLGLFTLYGHCSSINNNKEDFIKHNQTIAKTGKSGYAMGDHLHFGVLVQGVEVRPTEWQDSNWIKLNITDIISDAKNIIDNAQRR